MQTQTPSDGRQPIQVVDVPDRPVGVVPVERHRAVVHGRWQVLDLAVEYPAEEVDGVSITDRAAVPAARWLFGTAVCGSWFVGRHGGRSHCRELPLASR